MIIVQLEGFPVRAGVGVHVGKRLRLRRRMLQLTQSDVATACGVTFQQIQKYECAASQVSVQMLWNLSRVLDVPVSYFFEGLPLEEETRPLQVGHELRA
jgi:transcriptional regulator with XRE-family HTH domain